MRAAERSESFSSRQTMTMCCSSADYSQIELRLIAELSQDQGDDRGIPWWGGYPFGNRRALVRHRSGSGGRTGAPMKTVNFGIIYGVSAFGLSQQTDLSRSQAADLIRPHFETYRHQGLWTDPRCAWRGSKASWKPSTVGVAILKDINSRNGTVRGHAERNSVNAPIQGTAADVIKKAMICIQAELKKRELKTRMLLQVHDELLRLPKERTGGSSAAGQRAHGIGGGNTHSLIGRDRIRSQLAGGPLKKAYRCNWKEAEWWICSETIHSWYKPLLRSSGSRIAHFPSDWIASNTMVRPDISVRWTAGVRPIDSLDSK